MKASLQQKLDALRIRYNELGQLMSQPDVISNQDKFKAYGQEYAKLEPVVACFTKYQANLVGLESAKQLISEDDADMRAMAEEEIASLTKDQEQLELELKALLIPEDPNDECDVFLEIRAGTGGDEAAIFAGDLLRMYARYAELQGWNLKPVSENLGEHGGYKEVIARVVGKGVYSKLKFESGAHRVQRVPETESQGRVHTSACTVAVLPEIKIVEQIEIDPSQLRIDTFRSSGAGGQHVNTTDSAIRITHLPTGVVVECQDERSQHKNKARAMSLLQARLLDAERSKQLREQAETRRNLVGSGDRSERIRTYNFPQGRVTDHRINLTLYKLDEIIEGKLDVVVEPLIREHQADLLAQMAE